MTTEEQQVIKKVMDRLDDLEKQLLAIIDSIPKECQVIVKEGGGAVNPEASLAVSVTKLATFYKRATDIERPPDRTAFVTNNVTPGPSAGNRLVRCLKCGETFLLDREHVCKEGEEAQLPPSPYWD